MQTRLKNKIKSVEAFEPVWLFSTSPHDRKSQFDLLVHEANMVLEVLEFRACADGVAQLQGNCCVP